MHVYTGVMAVCHVGGWMCVGPVSDYRMFGMGGWGQGGRHRDRALAA